MKVMNFRQLLFWWFLSLLVSKSSSVRECLKSGFSKYKVSWQKVPRSTSGLLWEKYISKFAVQKRNQALSPAQFGQDGCSRRPTGVPVHDIQTLFFSKIYILLCFVFSSNLRHLSAYTVSGVVGWESGAPESHFSEFPFYREDLAALKKRKSHFIEFPFCREKSVLEYKKIDVDRGSRQSNPQFRRWKIWNSLGKWNRWR